MTEKKKIFNRDELFEKEISGIMGAGNSSFTVAVWSKIYDAKVLKSAVSSIHESLYFAEDVNLCMKFFFNEYMLKASVRPEAYYVWNLGIGFASSDKSDLALLQDYKYVKLAADYYAKQYHISDAIMYRVHLESIGLLNVAINNLILENTQRDSVERIISEISNYEFIRTAKNFIASHETQKLWDGLRFMISDYTPGEYYDWACAHLKKRTFRQKALKVMRKIKLF
ncbi:MAG: hypothetical protein Q4C58_12895 [Eubacteriales bacterium]|nr:hypothetical protein [Eubacteriales bacterium]